MTKGNLQVLNDHLFSQLDRLSGDELSDTEFDKEIKRAKAIVNLSDQIIGNAQTRLQAARLYAQYGEGVLPHLPQIGGEDVDERS